MNTSVQQPVRSCFPAPMALQKCGQFTRKLVLPAWLSHRLPRWSPTSSTFHNLGRLTAVPRVPPSRPLHCTPTAQAKKKEDTSPYRTTVNLPTTSFDMRANSVKREPQLQKFWEDNGVYEQLSRNNPGGTFTLHDGPPYANGDLHIGHALNKILKDVINKYQMLQGRRCVYVPGWDCHGLPIELKVLQSMSEDQRQGLTPIKLRRKARDFALKTVAAQKQQFQRYGIWADWQAPYLTLDPQYEAAQLKVFGQMVLNGHIYRGRKPVHWSPSSGTALAEAELEYPEGHVSQSIFVAMPMTSAGPEVPQEAQSSLESAAFAVWTTTPWTIPANLAVAVNDQLTYAVVEAQGEGCNTWQAKKLVVAADMVEQLSAKLGVGLTTLVTLPGAALEGCKYKHPLFDRESPVVIGGDYITTESGTGLVHTAPGHGQEDYQVGQRYGLPLLSPVDDEGVFTKEAGQFVGLNVQGEGNTAVIAALRESGVLLKQEAYSHKYPYDWRTKQPTIFRATDQWFASVEGFREAALGAIKDVKWVPASGENRIASMTEGRADWCISRQRKWGVPIPVVYYKESGEPLMTQETIAHITAVVAEHGSDAWWLKDIEELLPDSLKSEAPKLRKGEDTMDVWFDSGSSWSGVLEGREGLNYPADLYLEGSDQHRGWFQSSLLTSVAARGMAPYSTVLTHGFVLDERGMKMSKSLGNVVDPREIILGGKDAKKQPPLGADVLRLWVASVDYSSDVMIGKLILDQVSEVYRKLRFTLRYLLGNLSDYTPQDAVPYNQLPAADKYILSRFATLLDDLESSYAAYNFSKVYQSLQRFAVMDLSNFYLDVVKDRMYIRGAASTDRRSCQTVLDALMRGLLPAISPILSHMAEDAWQALPYDVPQRSVFQAGWLKAAPEWRSMSEEEVGVWRSVLALRGEVNQLMEKARSEKFLGASLEARVMIHLSNKELAQKLRQLDAADNGIDQLRYLFIVSQAQLVDEAAALGSAEYSSSNEVEGLGQVTLGISRAHGHKCSRCWNYSAQVGRDLEHPELCERCIPVIRDMGFALPDKVEVAV